MSKRGVQDILMDKNVQIVFVRLPGCQVGGHLKKGGKEDIFSGKGGQKEDIFSLKLIRKRQKQYQIYK